MFDVTTQRAQLAVCSVSDLLDSFSDLHEPMPSPNAPNKSAAKKSLEKKGVELGQQLARKRSQDFATKIQGWNQGGAGVVQQQNEVVVVEKTRKADAKSRQDDVVELKNAPTQSEDEDRDATPEDDEDDGALTTMPSSGTSGDPNMAISARTSREVDLERKAWVRRKSKPHVELALEVKNAVAPKKRVISDGHWRRDRTLKPETASPEKEQEKDTTPKPITIRRSVVSVGLKVPPSVQDFIDDEPLPVRVRPLRRTQSRSRSRERGAAPDYQDSGVKVYIKRTRRSKTSSDLKDPSTSQSSLTNGSSVDRAASSTDITTPAQSPTKLTLPRPATAPKEKVAKGAAYAEEELRRASARKTRPTAPEPDPKSKSTFTPIAPAAPAVYGSRIEGWLAGTQDPFVDRGDTARTPESLKGPVKKPNRPDDLSHDQDADDHRRSSGRRRRSRPSLEAIDTSRPYDREDTSLSATPTLRRSVARRATQSPIKARPTGGGADADTVTTVSDTDSSWKLPRGGNEHGFPSASHRLSTIASAETIQASRPRALSDASEHPTVIVEGSVLSRASDGDEPRGHGGSQKRRSAKHSDLISVLSQPRRENSRVKSRRSVRSRAPLLDSATIGDIMSELTTEELKYHRELRTLVDGVIPVLLTYVLQKTDATGAKRLFSGSSPDGQAVTRPIVEMGVALEKLKATHKRIPMHDPDELIKW
ncbi:hypothetical protein LTR33_012183, partial [Friedmanniomyces endolithicus]